MSLLRRALVCLTAAAALSGPALPAVAGGAPAVEGEHMPTAAGRTAVVLDGLASGRRARALPEGASVAVRLHTPIGADRLRLRLRSGRGAASPRVAVSLDGRRVDVVAVTSGTWRTYALPGRWSAGTYTLRLRSVDRPRQVPPVLVDRAVFGGRAAAAAPAPTAPAAPKAPAVHGAPLDDAYEARVVGLVNAERSRAGLPPLAVSSCADAFAESWSRHMAASGTFAHRPDLGPLLRRCAGSRVGENIAHGTLSADKLMDMWMASPGHRANILSRSYTHVGVGTARTGSGRVYATQNFLRLR